jgi:hypothetical protein
MTVINQLVIIQIWDIAIILIHLVILMEAHKQRVILLEVTISKLKKLKYLENKFKFLSNRLIKLGRIFQHDKFQALTITLEER